MFHWCSSWFFHTKRMLKSFTRWVFVFAEEKSMVQEEQPLPEHPEVMVFASYSGPPKFPMRVSVLREMVCPLFIDPLHRTMLRHVLYFSVYCDFLGKCQRNVATQRSFSSPSSPSAHHTNARLPPRAASPSRKSPRLETHSPAKEEGHSLIRWTAGRWVELHTSRDVTAVNHSGCKQYEVYMYFAEPAEPDRPIQSIEITSPFINYKVSPFPIPTDMWVILYSVLAIILNIMLHCIRLLNYRTPVHVDTFKYSLKH